MDKVSKKTFLYDFLISPRYKIGRHILLLFIMVVISLNQAFAIFEEGLLLLGNKIYLIALVFLLPYMVVGYYNLYVLVPKYLLTKKYVAYVVYMLLSIALLVVIQTATEYVVHLLWNIPYGRASMFNSRGEFLLDISSTYFTDAICIVGVSVTVLLKSWITENQRVAKLEKEHILSELEQLKDQVTPVFLFNILNRTGILAKTEPGKASEMLMKLSQILRYQLYDSGRDKVLLSAEITFMRNYLNLQQLYRDDFKYELETLGEVNRILLPPLLFAPFVQYFVNNMPEKSSAEVLFLRFEVEADTVGFYCRCFDKNVLGNQSFSNIKQRLSLLLPNNYTLDVINRKEDKMMIRLLINL